MPGAAAAICPEGSRLLVLQRFITMTDLIINQALYEQLHG